MFDHKLIEFHSPSDNNLPTVSGAEEHVRCTAWEEHCCDDNLKGLENLDYVWNFSSRLFSLVRN